MGSWRRLNPMRTHWIRHFWFGLGLGLGLGPRGVRTLPPLPPCPMPTRMSPPSPAPGRHRKQRSQRHHPARPAMQRGITVLRSTANARRGENGRRESTTAAAILTHSIMGEAGRESASTPSRLGPFPFSLSTHNPRASISSAAKGPLSTTTVSPSSSTSYSKYSHAPTAHR